MKTCIRCGIRKRGMKYLIWFPHDDMMWCTVKCIFLWLKETNFLVNGESVSCLVWKKGKKESLYYASDYY